jgi:hypothetical protein
MKLSLILVSGLLLTTGAPLVAQPIPAGQKIGLARYLQAGYGGLKTDVIDAAAKMPEADYGFKPSSMADVRTYGQLVAHIAVGQFDACAAAKAVPSPNHGRNLERELKTKAELVKALADSFAFCDDVFSSLTDASATEFVKMGQGEVVRSAVLVGILAHGNEMYGISTVYLRAKNLVPPSTERQLKRQTPLK